LFEIFGYFVEIWGHVNDLFADFCVFEFL